MKEKELFEYKKSTQHRDYIELYQSSDSTRGIYYGMEYNMDMKPIYYRSYFGYTKSERHKQYDIYFVLTKFDCSFIPFNADLVSDLIKDKSKLPFILNYPITFFGKRIKDTLELKRILDYYDSNADHFNFIKVKNIRGF